MIGTPVCAQQSVDLVIAGVDALWPRVREAPGPWLSPGEARRLERIANPARAREFVASRCLLRLLLSAHTGYAHGWWHWVLEAPDNATPFVQACRMDAAPLHLNLSHSQGLLACALSQRPVGVDLEVQRSRRRRDVSGLADMICSPRERAYLAGLADEQARQRAFTQLWTLKEACCKWRGTGLDLAQLPLLCSRAEPAPAEVQQAHCRTWDGRWGQRDYRVAVCTGALPGKVRAMALEAVRCPLPAGATTEILVTLPEGF